jgi:hypothetical protein
LHVRGESGGLKFSLEWNTNITKPDQTQPNLSPLT